MSKTDAARWSVDWARVIENLRTLGMSMGEIAEQSIVSKSSLYGYMGNNGLHGEPGFSAGKRILDLWVARTGYRMDDVPMWRRPLSVSEVMEAYR
jgi:hypothetical protein